MIFSHRRTALPSRRAFLETHAAFSESYRAHAVLNLGVVSDDRLSTLAFERTGTIGRPVVTIVLDGRARIEACGRSAWLGPGTLSVVEAKGAILMRQSAEGERFESLVLEWDAPKLGARPEGFTTHTLGLDALDDARAATLALRSGEARPAEVARSLVAVIARLDGAGVRIAADEEALLGPAPAPGIVDLSRALDELVSDMATRPMMVDLHARLGISLRTANRLVQEFNARYGFNASTWQDTRSRRRVLISAALLTARGATASEIASAMGYSSLPSLTRALRQAGMPAPRDIPAFVRELYDRDPAPAAIAG
jgi:hypothetical protein